MADGSLITETWDRAAIQALFDPATGALDRRVLSDEAIYRLELERIFARGWNFMCHDSQLKDPGDYLVSWIGEDQVIVVRGEDRRDQRAAQHLPAPRQRALPRRAGPRQVVRLQLPRLELRARRPAARRAGRSRPTITATSTASGWGW